MQWHEFIELYGPMGIGWVLAVFLFVDNRLKDRKYMALQRQVVVLHQRTITALNAMRATVAESVRAVQR